jgi:hypothetical protein
VVGSCGHRINTLGTTKRDTFFSNWVHSSSSTRIMFRGVST